MSISFNTSSAASAAVVNLDRYNQEFRTSLTRLSGGNRIVEPGDDSGGLAVSMKLNNALIRQTALETNIANAQSYLQTQDGALATSGQIMMRMSELKSLAQDPTKNASDISNYNSEFIVLKEQSAALGSETFNGIDLFGTDALSVITDTEGSASGTVDLAGINLLDEAEALFDPVSESFSDLDAWTTDVFGGLGGPSVTVSGGALNLNSATGSIVSAETNDTYSGAFELSFDFSKSGTGGGIRLGFRIG